MIRAKSVQLDQWSHVVLVGEQFWMRLYVDGRLADECYVPDFGRIYLAEFAFTPTCAPTQPFCEGSVAFDDVAMFDKSLDVREVAALAGVGRGHLPKALDRPAFVRQVFRWGWPVVTAGLALLSLAASTAWAQRAVVAILCSFRDASYRPVWLVLGTGLLATLVVTAALAREAIRTDRARFDGEVQSFADQIRETFLRIADLTNAGRDWAAAQTNLTQAGWERWTDSRSMEHDFPGLLGLGYAEAVYPHALAEHQQRWSDRHGFPFRIWPDGTTAPITRPRRLLDEPRLPVVVYQPWHLAPALWRTNATIFGRDLLALRDGERGVKPEPERIEDAIGSGNIMSSGLVEVAPAGWYGERIMGIRLYSPQARVGLGDNSDIPQGTFAGVAFASVDLKRWLVERLQARPPQVGFRIWTGESYDNRHELGFDSGDLYHGAGWRPDPYLTATREIRLFHYRLWVDFWTTSVFEAQSQRRWPWFSAGVGGGFTLLTAGLLFVQVRGREKEAAIAERLRVANAELSRAERERARWSRDLHDGTVQNLYAVGLHLQFARRHLAEAESKTAQGLEEGQRLVQDTIVELREFLLALKDETLTHRTFAQIMDDLFTRLRRTAPVEFALVVDPTADTLPAWTVVQLVNVVREAISNAVRHGQPNHIGVALQPVGTPGAYRLEVRDDGRGFEPAKTNVGGFGLLTMRERAAELTGTFTVESSPGHGTVVRVEFPAT